MLMQKLVYSIDETATLLEVHTDTIRRMIKAHTLQATRVGRQWRIPQTEIDRLLGRNNQKPEDPDVMKDM
jgi:excisionase family DNA binding protein